MNKSDSVTRKFVESFIVSDWEIETDTGWEDITSSNKTVEYDVWEIETSGGKVLRGADNHIIFDEGYEEIFLKDSLSANIVTEDGAEEVTRVANLGYSEHMYDLSVNSLNHRYYSNGILSHNTTCAAGYLLWYAMFVPDSYILVASKTGSDAIDIMDRIRFAYESLPDFIRAGVREYNKKSMKFDNGSAIISTTTTAHTGRGKSISLIYLDEFAFVDPPSMAKELWTSLSPTLSCLSYDTMVHTQNGLVEIGKLHEGRQVGDYFEYDDLLTWGRSGLETVSHGYVSPYANTRIATNEYGMYVEATLEHPLYVAGTNGGYMKKMGELTTDDYVRIDIGMEVYGNNSMSASNAYMLGGYTAEGWSSKNKNGATGIYISNTDAGFRDVYLENGFTEVNGSNHKLKKFGVNGVCKEYADAGVNLHHLCHEKRVPSGILCSDKETQCNYLAGLFDGDGSVTDRSINLTSTSKLLIRDVQLIMLNMGFTPRVYLNDGSVRESRVICENQNMTCDYLNSWSLNIPLSQYEMFLNTIPLRISRKIGKLKQIINIREQDDFKQYRVPVRPIEETLRAVIESCKVTKHWFRKHYGIRFDKMLDGKADRTIPVRQMRIMSDAVKSNFPEVWGNYERFFNEYTVNATWGQLKSFETSANITYDFTVPDSHSFIQSGFMGSNTGGKVILTSTPNSDQDQFAEIWFDAIKRHDSEGNLYPNGVGKNGFGSFFATYEDHPERDEEWARIERGKIGDERFRREHLAEFVVFEETLINSVKLADMVGSEPYRKTGSVRWYDRIKPDSTYAVSLDPCMGTGGDNAAITVWELPSMTQVAEWTSNTTRVEGQIRILREILLELWSYDKPSIYWSLENNTVGEAALVVIRDTGVDNFPGVFMSGRRTDGVAKKRKGYTTTNKNKMKTCATFKQWIEADLMKPKSATILTEMKNYVAKGIGYQAKQGTTDDVISSTLIAVRMIEDIGRWEEEIFEVIDSNIDDDEGGDYRPPLPLIM